LTVVDGGSTEIAKLVSRIGLIASRAGSTLGKGSANCAVGRQAGHARVGWISQVDEHIGCTVT